MLATGIDEFRSDDTQGVLDFLLGTAYPTIVDPYAMPGAVSTTATSRIGKSIPRMVFLFSLGCCTLNHKAHGQPLCSGASPEQRISNVRAESNGRVPGPLFVIIGKSECRLSDKALKAWIVAGGKKVVFSTPGGAGGYENEGQALQLYDLASDTQRVVLSEYFAITGVEEVRTRGGREALIVEMRDGGLGASHIAVVDPNRGEVFVEHKVMVVSRRDDVFTLGYFHDNEWESIARGESVHPYYTKSYDLNLLLNKKTIVRERTPQ